MKAILVIDMPDEAKAEDYHMEYGLFTHKGEKPFRVGEIAFECKNIDLKPLPEKRKLHQYVGDRCYHCRFFNGEKSSVGIACTNPMKEWRTRTAKYKQPSMKACKMFERKQEE